MDRDTQIHLALLVASYLFGAISFALLAVRARRGVDLRQIGSGNLGATNAGRILGKSWAIGIYILDFLKGFLPTATARWLLHDPTFLHSHVGLALLAGVAAFLGHCWPVWHGFKGGKGVATASGMICALSPLTFATILGLFGLALALFRIVSLGSLVASVSLPIVYVLMVRKALEPGPEQTTAIVFTVMAAIVTYRHRGNIRRIFAGTEPRIGRKTP